eukprot:764719-Hanusia_phi.AAC.2
MLFEQLFGKLSKDISIAPSKTAKMYMLLTGFAELRSGGFDVQVHELASVAESFLELLSLTGVKEGVSRLIHGVELPEGEGSQALHPQWPQLYEHASAEHRGGVEVDTIFLGPP